MIDLYLLPGLGADRRIFERLDLAGHAVHYLDWPEMPEGSTLKDYAMALAPAVDDTRSHVLVGMSMGGMVAQELAVLTKPERTIVLSTWKGPDEMPPPIKLLRNTHPERALTEAFLARTMPLLRWQMGAEDEVTTKLLDELIAVHSIDQLKVQINACLEWEGPEEAVEDLVHIHGSRDRLMPIRYIVDPIVVKGGGHFMVHTHAEEVSSLLKEAL